MNVKETTVPFGLQEELLLARNLIASDFAQAGAQASTPNSLHARTPKRYFSTVLVYCAKHPITVATLYRLVAITQVHNTYFSLKMLIMLYC